MQSRENLKKLWQSEHKRFKKISNEHSNALLNRFAKSIKWEYLKNYFKFLNLKPDFLFNLTALQVRKANTILSVMEGILTKIVNKNISEQAMQKLILKQKAEGFKDELHISSGQGNQFGALQVDFLEAVGMDSLQIGLLGDKGLRVQNWSDIPYAAKHISFLRSLILISRFVKGSVNTTSKFFTQR